MSVAESQRCGGMGVPFRVVQPWGPDKVQQSTMLSEHQTAAAAFAEIDSRRRWREPERRRTRLNSWWSTWNATLSSVDGEPTEM